MRATVSDVPICHYRLSRIEYDRAVEAGAFEPDAKLELIDGNLHAMTPEGSRHALGMDLVADCLRGVFAPGSTYGYSTRWRLTTTLSPSRTWPSRTARCAITGTPIRRPRCWSSKCRTNHCGTTVKQRLHARCRIPEYWILALPENRLEVYRNPAGDGYQSVTNHAAGDKVAPLARPDAQIPPGLEPRKTGGGG